MTGTHIGTLILEQTTVRRATYLALAALLVFGATAAAQVPVDDEGNPVGEAVSPLDGASLATPGASAAALTPAELATLVGPIALYPDDLLAIVLPASTYPLDIVQAARYLELVQNDASLEPEENWDDSIVALLNYPEVVELMNDDLDWTWSLGEAVVAQQSDVISAIEAFRDRAYAAGNLQSDERQTVSVDDGGVIEIEPAEEDIIYVPYYEPERVVYASPTPVYHYYPRPYPVYYYPYPQHHYLTSGLFWGVTTAFTVGWASNNLHVYHPTYFGHPFYGRNYGFYGGFWRRPSINVYNAWYVNNRSPYYRYRFNRGDYWRPRHRSGARPRTQVVDSGYYRNRGVARDRRGGERYAGNRRLRTDVNGYRDRRTDGRRYTGGNSVARTDAGRGAGRGNRVRQPGASGRTRGSSADGNGRGGSRDEIRFRSRGDGSYSGQRRARIQRSADAAERRRTGAGRTSSEPATRGGRSRASEGSQRIRQRTERRSTPAIGQRAARASTPRQARSATGRQARATTARQARSSAPRQARSSTPRQARSSTPRQARSSTPRQVRSAAPRQARSSTPRQARSSAPRQARSSAPRQSRSSTPRQSRSSAPRQSRSSSGRSGGGRSDRSGRGSRSRP